MELLEDCIIDLLAEYSIKGEKIEDAVGIWIGKGSAEERKICAMGVKCTRFVTMHGLALNVTTDMEMFNATNPCGFRGKGVTSMQRELGYAPDIEEVKRRFTEIFMKKFGFA